MNWAVIGSVIVAVISVSGAIVTALIAYRSSKGDTNRLSVSDLNDRLYKEIGRLEARIDEIELDNGKLIEENESLEEENAKLHEENQGYRNKIEKLENRVDELEDKLGIKRKEEI